MDVGIEIQSERIVNLRLDNFTDDVRAKLLQSITANTEKLAAAVKRAAPRKTGKLEASIESRVVQTSQRRIVGIVGVTSDFGKAGALEYGSDKDIDFMLTHIWDIILSPAIKIQRTLDLRPHEFLRGPLDGLAPDIFEDMKKAVQEAVAND